MNAGLLNTYAAGSSTPTNTFTTNLGNVANANPIVLGIDGRPPQEIWLTGGTAYKLLLTDSLLNTIGTYDNLYGIGDPAAPNAATGYWPLSSVSGTNTVTATASAGCALTANNIYTFKVATTNTGAVTLNITPSGGVSLGAIAVVKRTSGGTVALVANDLISGTEQLLLYDGASFQIIGSRPYAQGASVTSASTINLDTATGDYVQITGNTQVTAITLAQGEERTLEFASTVAVSSNAVLILPGGTTITSAAGDTAIFRGEASGVVRCIVYSPASVPPLTGISYSTGTWTPVLTFATPGDLSVVYATNGQQGYYTKIGRLVTASCLISTSTFTFTTASGNLQITGLPFAARTQTGMIWHSGALAESGLSLTGSVTLAGRVASAASLMTFVVTGGTGSQSNVASGNTTSATNVVIEFTITYEATS